MLSQFREHISAEHKEYTDRGVAIEDPRVASQREGQMAEEHDASGHAADAIKVALTLGFARLHPSFPPVRKVPRIAMSNPATPHATQHSRPTRRLAPRFPCGFYDRRLRIDARCFALINPSPASCPHCSPGKRATRMPPAGRHDADAQASNFGLR